MTKARDISSLIGAGGIIDNSKITLDAAEVPSLDTAKITTGTFASARIDNNSLSAITTLPSGVGGTAWQSVQTSGFTAVAGRGYPCNTTSAAFTVTLPATPSVGDTIILLDYAGTFATNNITLGANSNKINGVVANKLLTTNREATTLVYVDATQGWVASSGVNEGTAPSLTSVPYSVDFLVVAGGGGSSGGNLNEGGTGGGGGGGMRTSTQTVSVGTVITVTVGDGGAGTASATPASSGSNSSISGSGLTTITSAGGGYGSHQAQGAGAGSGGSGGGAGWASGAIGSGNTPSTSPSQGANGGNYTGFTGGGGGGGGGSSGVIGGDTVSPGTGGTGGNGTTSSITGSSTYYAGGGAGGSWSTGSGINATGGLGGGGNGTKVGTATSGTANTGGGGGGVGQGTGGNGGKGVVILSMPSSSFTGTVTGSPVESISGANKILVFNGSGSYTA